MLLEHLLTFSLFINLTFGFHGFPSLIYYKRLIEILINAGLWVVTVKCLEIIVGLCLFFYIFSFYSYLGRGMHFNLSIQWMTLWQKLCSSTSIVIYNRDIHDPNIHSLIVASELSFKKKYQSNSTWSLGFFVVVVMVWWIELSSKSF